MSIMPNFIIFGAPRSGTASTYQYLRQHPEIVMSFIKETQFFTYLASQSLNKKVEINMPWPAKTLEEYQGLFHPKKDYKAVGEATARYFFVPGVPEKIKLYLPKVHLICILRNPVERAYSHYLLNVREGFEERKFEDALNDELIIERGGAEKTIDSRNYYLRAGFYSRALNRYFEYFDRKQISIFFYDDLIKSPLNFIQSIFASLGVGSSYVPDTSTQFNHGGIPLVKRKRMPNQLKYFILRIRQLLPQDFNMRIYRLQLKAQNNLLRVPTLSLDTVKFLRDTYTDDIQNLEKIAQRNLSGWLHNRQFP